MSQEVQIRNAERPAKIRSPWAVALLPFVTFGIYHLVWWYRINRELRDYGVASGHDLGQSPTNSLLALFPGGFVIVPPIVSYWRGTKRVQQAARVGGVEPVNGWLALILYLVISPAFYAYLQVSLNNLWRVEASGTPGSLPAPSAVPMAFQSEPPTARAPRTPVEEWRSQPTPEPIAPGPAAATLMQPRDAAQGGSAPELVISAPYELRGQAFRLTKPQMTMGRALENDFRLEDPHVSRHHALIHLDNGQVVIEDTQSSGGIVVNGLRIAAPTPLRPGDRVGIGGIELFLRNP
jgi:FHA domain/Domain of unknown function (DUF4234)